MSEAALLRMHDYTTQAKAYWWATAVLGVVALAFALRGVAALETAAILQVLLGMLFAAIIGLFPVRVPGAKTSGSAAEIFVFLLLLDFGPEAAVIAAAAEAGVISWRTSARWTSRIGSPAMAALAMSACGTAFSLAQAHLPIDASGTGAMFALLLALSVAYFAAGTLLMASLIKLKRGEPIVPLRILRDHAWLGLAYAGSGSIAGLLHTSFGRFGFSVIFAAAPVIAALLATLRVFFRHLEAESAMQAERVAAAEHAAAESARHLTELRESEDRFESAFTHAAVGMVLVSAEGRILQVNTALARLLGRCEADFAGTDLSQMFHPDDQELLRSEMRGVLSAYETSFSLELRCRHHQGIDVWASLNGSLFTSRPPLSRCLILQLQDITARRRAESRLQHIAYHDGLTDLPNRSYFTEQLARAIAVVQRHPERRFAVLILDVDRFKLVNDSLGHNAGDQLLIELAARLQAYVRPTDLTARLGGDEFAILVEDMNADVEALRIAERLQEVLTQPVYLKGLSISTSASIGITTSTFGYEAPEQVMRDADTAMYRAKAQAKGRYAVFDSALHAEVTMRLWMETELRRAVANGQLHMVYQPIFELSTGRLTGFEALARWTHREHGTISPDRFIRVAEETGQILSLGRWALTTACRELRIWNDLCPKDRRLTMHVNVSGVQLVQPDFAANVRETIRTTGIEPGQLAIELTESVLVEKLPVAVPHLESLREIGVRISIDDFGTGYSSFSALRKLPINVIKIDRSFVTGLGSDTNGDEIFRGILALGRTLDKKMIAEGIETQAQLQRLIELDCENGQGFLLARPMTADVAESVIRAAHGDAGDDGAALRRRAWFGQTMPAPHVSTMNPAPTSGRTSPMLIACEPPER
jgi:diguanylate cyclase (GGDEF)-like protein/PAS domain S-box-containing protein